METAKLSEHTQPLVSAIIPTYNRSNYLKEAIESVLAQTYKNIEVIVIDDGSTDDTCEVASKYGNRLKYLRSDNQGVAVARNAGIKQAQGSLLAFLDDDDRWLPPMLERMIPGFHDGEDVGVIHCKAQAFDNKGHKWDHPFIGDTVNLHILLRSHFPPLQASVFRRSLFEKLGGFDSELTGSEDWDIFLRASLHCRFVAVPEVLMEIRSHTANMSKNIARMSTVSLRVLEKNNCYHSDCAECRRITRETKSWLKHRLFDAHRIKAKEALRNKHYCQAFTECFRSLTYNRSYLLNLPANLLRHTFHRSNVE